MKCTSCGERNPTEALQCAKCGEPLLDALDQSASHSFVSADTMARGPAPTVIPPATQVGDATGPQVTFSVYGLSGSGEGGADRTLTGTFAGRYEILAILGVGGMGKVYKVRDRELDKTIALKTIKGESDPASIQRFKQELVLARKITHKNVVRIYDLGEAEGVKYFTMEYIEGDSLKGVIRRREHIPPDEAIGLSRQILAGLHEAHAQGVIHRDLKPQNIMVDESSVAHLMDFGIARSTEATGMTATGAVVGTADYMSPEQVKGQKAGPPSDIFSFGAILYEMLTGDVPYKGDTPVSKIMMRLTTKPRSPREQFKHIPKYLEAVVLKCMEVDPALRYQSVPEILNDLDRSQVDRGLTTRLTRAVSRRPGPVLAAGAAALLAAGAALWWARARSPAPSSVAEASMHTVAILPFTNATGSPDYEWLRSGLPEMLMTDLSQSRYVRPVSSERLYKVLRQIGIAEQMRFDEEALESVSKLAPAQSVLFGQFVESGGKLRLDMTLRRAGSGVPIPLKAEGTTKEVFALVDEITSKVKSHLDLTPQQLRGDSDRAVAEVSSASLEAQRAYQSALVQLQQGGNQAAIPLLKEATAKDPSFATAYARLAEAYMNAGETQEAEAAVERARMLSERAALPLAERYRIHATAALVKEDYETAVKSYEELTKLYPHDPDLQMSLAQSLRELGKLKEAIAAFKRCLMIDPGFGAALISLGRTQVAAGDNEGAIASAQEALAGGQFKGDDEATGMIHSVLGVAYRETGQLDQAEENLKASLELRRKVGDKRGQAVTLTNLAQVYDLRGQPDRALDQLKRALPIVREMGDQERESNIILEIGLVHKAAGKLDLALAAFRESLQIERGRKDYANLANRLNHVADVYRMKGQYDDALVYLEQARSNVEKSEDKTEQANNLANIGLIKKAQGHYGEAVEAYMGALPLFQEADQQMGVGEVHQYLADIYARQGRYGDAWKSLQQSSDIYQKLQVEHGIGEIKVPMAVLLTALGRFDEAEKLFAEAEKGGHTHAAPGAHGSNVQAELLLGKAELLHLRGRREQAAPLYEQANVQANLGGKKEVAVESRIELGRLYLEQGKLDNAERLLLRTREEAKTSRLDPLESAAAAALADVLLARGQAEGSRKAALEATSLADKFSGRPIVYRAQVTLGEALQKMGRGEEAMDAYAKAASTLDWIRGSLPPEHVGSFVERPDIQGFLRKTVGLLEKGGRTSEAAPLRKWLGQAPPSGS
jgi:tetratricopeptide (TPR) repeat protein